MKQGPSQSAHRDSKHDQFSKQKFKGAQVSPPGTEHPHNVMVNYGSNKTFLIQVNIYANTLNDL